MNNWIEFRTKGLLGGYVSIERNVIEKAIQEKRGIRVAYDSSVMAIPRSDLKEGLKDYSKFSVRLVKFGYDFENSPISFRWEPDEDTSQLTLF